jgi:uncharacterized membrane protein (DUF2068 family)
VKDTVITAARKKTELRTFLVCLGIAFAVNVGAIIYYKTPFYEAFTQVGYMLVIALTLYLVWTVVRLVRRLLGRKEEKKDQE